MAAAAAAPTPQDGGQSTSVNPPHSPPLSSQSSPSLSTAPPSPNPELDGTSSGAHGAALPLQQASIAASFVLAILALRGGLFNVILILATAAALLLNPYVRTFLELPTGDKANLGPLDPAKYFTAFAHDNKSETHTEEASPDHTEASHLEPLPPHVQESIDQLAPLVVRDFIQGWYTHHSFGFPNFPSAARSTMDHMVASIWTRAIHSRLHSVDVATELLLTGSSVFLACLRRKRFANHAAAAGDRMAAKAAMRGGTGHWNTNEERIASLRAAMRAFFARHLPKSESQSQLVFPLVTEILTKQLWNLLLTVGEPDFLNRNLVGWKEKQIAAAGVNGTSASSAAHRASEDDFTAPSATPSRPASRVSQRPISGIAAPPPRPPSVQQQQQQPPAASRSSISQSPLPDRPPSVPPRPSISSPNAAAGGTAGPPLSIPDRSMISTPPSRSDSPMMPSFASTVAGGSAAAGAVPGRVMSPTRNSLDQAGHGSPSSPITVSPYAYGNTQPRLPSRTSMDLSEGLSNVVGGLGSVIKGVGKGADAFVGGVGDVLTTNHPDATPERLRHSYHHTPQPRPQQQPRASSPAATTMSSSSDVWRRSPSSVDRASTNADAFQHQHNAIRRKQAPNKESDATDFMASQAAWPSNLPPGLDKSAEGENLPPSLVAGLRRQNSGAGRQGTYRIDSPTRSSRSPMQASSPPKMNTSLPYEISPRASIDGAGYYKGANPHRSSTSSPIISSQPQPAPGVPSRPPSSLRQTPSLPPRPHPGMSSLPPAPSLSSVLSRSDTEGLYDEFEAFLEGSSPALITQSVPGEGEELLRLQVGLGTIERLVPRSAGEEAEMFREDASTILAKAREGLEKSARSVGETDARARPVKTVIRKLHDAVDQLGFGPHGFAVKEGTVRDALEPVQAELTARLQTLFALFWKSRCDAKKAAGPAPQSQQQRSFSPSMPSMQSGLNYEPRKKENVGATAQTSAAPPGPTPVPAGPTSTNSSPTATKRTSLQAPKPRQAILDHLINLDDDEDDDDGSQVPAPSVFDANYASSAAAGAGQTFNVAVTDISPNADRPDAAVDTRTFEFICAVEGSEAEGGGYVLVRSWGEIVTLQKELRRAVMTSGRKDASIVPSLPITKGKTSTMLCTDLESFLSTILTSADLANTAPVAQFADRTRAGTSAAAAVARTGFNPFSSGVEFGRTLGKNLVDGVGAVGKAAATGLQLPAGTNAARTSSATPVMSTDTAVTGLIDTAERNAAMTSDSSVSATTTPANAITSTSSRKAQGLSTRGLDAILTSIFALADEALSLTGAWSMRRGVVRLLQSVVRQSYSSSIISAFDGVSSSLSSTSVSSTLDFIRTTFWADGPDAKWTHVKGPPRSAKERIESEEKAREIVKGYAPTQAAFVLGPGGKQACEKALEAVHGVICDDEGALDLALTLTLRLLQML